APGYLHGSAQISSSGNPSHGRRVGGSELALVASGHQPIEELKIRRCQVGRTIASVGDKTHAPEVAGLQGKLLYRIVGPQLLRVGIREETVAVRIGHSTRHRLRTWLRGA